MNAWGAFYSAYSPVFDASGEVAGIIAADFSTEWYESQLSERTRATVISYGVILFVTLLVAAALSRIIVTPFVRRQEQLSIEAEKRAEENKQLSLQIVRSLADAVDAKDPYTNGHDAGDKALWLMGEILTENGEHAICCRLGGDEFLGGASGQGDAAELLRTVKRGTDE